MPDEYAQDRLQSDILSFFDKAPAALPLYEALQAAVLAIDGYGPVRIKVSRTQISFYVRHLFACASLARVRPKRELPAPYLTVTFGLGHRVEDARIAVATEPYPHRWTHHLVLGSAAEVDAQLIAWLREAAAFAACK